MLAERVKEWPKQWMAEGEKKGVDRGQRKMLKMQIEAKFGPLSAADKRRLKTASQKSVNLWGKRILTANSIDEVFDT